ncbi:ATP-binding cassette domain-containing protein [Sedimentitalea sp. JM2-8]|uniref:ATP-binding cassette domain-containing protein n=1 Tax=Sedimentitalea xiamensis TaxID=3050037 RepID=A0ABT7FJF3_9RHOB|nr:ATP-binding cassette domain-containing protein [Sedimentitalea xiamensis]MDK3075222.1 ATP-binding cassette domain-containing protein [Sedimentitalea xiamensis]
MTDGLILRDGDISLRDGDRAFRLRVDEFSLAAGKTVALTGASGSGKTLLLELLGLLRAPGGGTRYRWEGQGGVDLAGLWSRGARSADLARTRGRLFGFVPQTGGLMPFLTVSENIALPQRVNGRTDAARCDALIDRLGLRDVAAIRPGALSIGQRQRTAIARALSHRPAFVIADEPTAALDSDSADTVLDLLLDVAKSEGSGVILSSHDVERLARFDIPRLRLSVRTVGNAVTSSPEAVPC